jgi:phage gpG-like protein
MPSEAAVFQVIATPGVVPDGDLAELAALLSDLSPVLDSMATVMSQWQIQNFDDQGATFGQPWAPLKPSTLREKQRLGFSDQPLVRYGRIASEIGETMLLTEDSVTVGINLDFAQEAIFHDDPGPGSHVPQRLLIALVPQEIEALQKRLVDYICQRLGKMPEGVSIVTSGVTMAGA